MEEEKVRMIERRGVKAVALIVLVVVIAAAVLLIQGKDSIFGPAPTNSAPSGISRAELHACPGSTVGRST